MTLDQAKKKIETEPDFIYSNRFGHSLKKCLERYPDGAPTKVIAQVLLMTEEEVELVHQDIIKKLRVLMKVDE